MRHRLDPATVAALGVAVLAVSSSGPLIAYAAAPALAIAFWRNALAVSVLAPATLLRRRDEVRALAADRGWLWSVLAGAALAVHFATWVPSVKLTSIATATALVATQPVWNGLIAVGQGRRLGGWTWLGIGLAVAGAAVTTGVDLSHDRQAVLGDLLALVGALAAAVYTSLGERARVRTSTTTYTAICYSVCAVALLGTCLVLRAPLTGYSGQTWLALLALTVGAQLLGHSMFNFSLRRIAATTVSVLILLEVPGAALLGWVWLRQAPPAAAWPGLMLLVAGVAVVILGSRRRVSPPAPDPVELPR